ncbi:MAG: hypothetical protein AAF542_09855 [Pseudomonadota bacterium]
MHSAPGKLLRKLLAGDGMEYEVRRLRLNIPVLNPAEANPALFAVYRRDADCLSVLLAGQEAELATVEAKLLSGTISLQELGRSLHLPVIDSRLPVKLLTLGIPKPWGQEIWYTGIEARGVCAVKTLTTGCPLNWWLAAIPETISGLGQKEAPILLKILAPHSEPVLGDLYFELHEIKREVYVISAINESAWPGGVGAIRIGFNSEQRAEFESDEVFKKAYAVAVANYRQVRVQIDEWLLANGFLADDPCDLASVKTSLQRVPEDLQCLEKQLRMAMDAFTQLHPIAVGDVVVIPRNLPHSLQHGVRAVEFQTPVYERKIVSFAQRVLTQSHWDTDDALLVTDMQDYEPARFDAEPCGQGMRQKIVDFDDFSVWRYTLPAESAAPVGDDQPRYLLLLSLIGNVSVAETALQSEQALLLPAALIPAKLHNNDAGEAVVLVAMPS